MKNKQLEEFISKICNLVDLDCYYDGGDFEEYDEEINLMFEGVTDIGLNISTDFERFSIFLPFHYYDYNISDVKNGKYDEEDLEYEKRTGLLENLFVLWAKNMEKKYPITVWDDGSYMCPGYVAWVGYYDIPYNDDAVVTFVKMVNVFIKEYQNSSNMEIREVIFSLLCKENNIFIEPNKTVILDRNITFAFSENRENIESNIEDYYIGKEYAFFRVGEKKYVAKGCSVKLFYEAFELCEMYDDILGQCNEEKIILCSEHMTLILPSIEDKGIYTEQEENDFLIKAKSFTRFASDKFQDVFYTHFSELMDESNKCNIMIFTEGITDYLHMEKYLEFFQFIYPQCKIKFWDYGITKEKNFKQEMGGPELLKMCKQFSKIEHNIPMIFIADCDVHSVAVEMEGVEEKKYKNWGNNVYSFTIPIPPHRMGETGICIEHLYTDDEIKQKFVCKDGKERRLYLGNEFDNYGRNLTEELMCTKINFCGKNSSKIIDGASDARVLSYKREDSTNYALSKIEFASKVRVNSKSKSFHAFMAIYDIIYTIYKDVYENGN